MPENSPPVDPGIHRILVPIDLEDGSSRVFAHALKLALCTGATLTAVHVRDDPDRTVDWTGMPSALDYLVDWGILPPGSTEADVASLQLHVELDDRVDRSTELGIIRAIIERLPNIIVLGTEGRTGWERLRQGSVAEAVARRAGAVTLFLPHGIPGFVDPDTGAARIRRVLMPVGGQAEALQHGVDVLEAFLEVLGVRIVDIEQFHAGDDPFPGLRLPEHPGWSWRQQVGKGDIVDGIIDAMHRSRPDLIVMGTRGHDSLADAIRGSRTEQVIRRAVCPVLAVPLD